MLRKTFGAFIGLLIYSIFSSAFAALSPSENLAITRLWTGQVEFVCTAFQGQYKVTSYLVSAGHCSYLGGASRVGRLPYTSKDVKWLLIAYDSFVRDVSIGESDKRLPALPLADTLPTDDERVWVHGFRGGNEGIVPARWHSWAVFAPAGALGGGNSGSPILNNSGQVVALLWGGQYGEFYDTIYFMDVNVIKSVLDEYLKGVPSTLP